MTVEEAAMQFEEGLELVSKIFGGNKVEIRNAVVS